MERPRVCVVDNSPSIRETIAIVLGARYRVTALTAEQFLSDRSHTEGVDLLILGDVPSHVAPVATAEHIPVLRLAGASEPSPESGRAQGALDRLFRPEELQDAVEALLARQRQRSPTFSALAVIDYPMLPREATDLARSAAQTTLPVLIAGETGTGKGRLARAIHALGPAQTFVTLTRRTCNAADLRQAVRLAPGEVTAFVNEVADLDAESQDLVLELLESGGLSLEDTWRGVRVICATRNRLESLPRMHGLDRELLYRLSVLPLHIPPLRERASDIPALAEHVGRQVGTLLCDGPLSFTPRALERLAHYLWFGNVAEFEAVLLRSAALRRRRHLDADDLLFGYAPLTGGPAPCAARAGVEGPAVASGGNETVDLVISELAHEFKNPMVTIKTVSQGIERLATDKQGRQQIARLTGDAVERMDRALENLMQYSRFREPDREPASLHSLLAPSLSDITATLAERGVALDYHPPVSMVVSVDSAQLSYAFDNLLRAIARDLQEGETLRVRPLEGSAGVVFEFPSTGRGVGAKLAGLSAAAAPNGSPPPLGIVLARSLVQRNGGRLETAVHDGNETVTVRLPGRTEESEREGMHE